MAKKKHRLNPELTEITNYYLRANRHKDIGIVHFINFCLKQDRIKRELNKLKYGRRKENAEL